MTMAHTKKHDKSSDASAPSPRHGAGHRRREKTAKTLASCAEGEKALICFNDDLKTLEMGFCNGSVAEVIHNVSRCLNLIVKINGIRYAIPRKTAQNIRVRQCSVN